MALVEINRDPTPRQIRQFALFWLPAFCLLLGGLAVYRYAWWPAAWTLAGIGALSVVFGVFRPTVMRMVFIGWMWAAFPIGWLVSHLLLGAIFFLVLTPIGLIVRAVGRDPLERKLDRAARTYWIARPGEADPASYFRQF
jgi:hypothetical protein